MRKIKIVCTIGPASETREKITGLCLAGMNVVRLNFSHNTDVLFYTAKKIAEQELQLQKGDKIVIKGGDTSGASGNNNLIKIKNIYILYITF